MRAVSWKVLFILLYPQHPGRGFRKVQRVVNHLSMDQRFPADILKKNNILSITLEYFSRFYKRIYFIFNRIYFRTILEDADKFSKFPF